MIGDVQPILRALVYTHFKEEELQDLYRRSGLGPEEQVSLWQILNSWRAGGSSSTHQLVSLAEHWVGEVSNLSAVSQAFTALTTELAKRNARARRVWESG